MYQYTRYEVIRAAQLHTHSLSLSLSLEDTPQHPQRRRVSSPFLAEFGSDPSGCTESSMFCGAKKPRQPRAPLAILAWMFCVGDACIDV